MKRRVMVWMVGFGLTVLGLMGATAVQAAEVGCFPLSGSYVCSPVLKEPTFVEPDPLRDEFVKTTKYGRLADFANVYAGPSRGAEVLRNAGDGYLFASIYGATQNDAGELWYMINAGEYVHADDITIRQASEFRGVKLTENPPRPFGWVVSRDFTPSSEPGGEPDPRFADMYRYDFFEVYDAVEDDEGWLWYSLGDGRWIQQIHVSLVDWNPAPEDVGEDEFWVEIDLYEQTMAAYEGDRMVFATLISSGLNWWPTREGLFQVWEKWQATKMSGAEGRKDYYFVEDVPHTMYFDREMEIALHGAYWHDRFGYKHSHGCVNMPPQDSEWVYYWSEQADNDLWVWVHTSDPHHYFDRYDTVSTFSGP